MCNWRCMNDFFGNTQVGFYWYVVWQNHNSCVLLFQTICNKGPACSCIEWSHLNNLKCPKRFGAINEVWYTIKLRAGDLLKPALFSSVPELLDTERSAKQSLTRGHLDKCLFQLLTNNSKQHPHVTVRASQNIGHGIWILYLKPRDITTSHRSLLNSLPDSGRLSIYIATIKFYRLTSITFISRRHLTLILEGVFSENLILS
jgi:hypothetical protein